MGAAIVCENQDTRYALREVENEIGMKLKGKS